ncbi:hypothetical protein BDR26DRAFT_284171 [Obelidium mucronatum]|nr:hypothetical protein BDR26DRAFT_284171 [Obelidium mucronatum]
MALVSTPEAIVWVPCSDIAAVSRDGRLWHPTMLKTTTPTATSDLSGKGKERAVEPIVVTKEPKGGVEPVCIQNEINALKKDSADPIACFPASSLPIPVIYELVDCVFKVDICSAVKLFESCSLFRKYGFKILAKRLLSHLPNGIHDVEVTLSKEHLEYFRQIPQSFELEWKVGSVITKILNAYFHVYDSFYKTFEFRKLIANSFTVLTKLSRGNRLKLCLGHSWHISLQNSILRPRASERQIQR